MPKAAVKYEKKPPNWMLPSNLKGKAIREVSPEEVNGALGENFISFGTG